ncbi:MAG: LysM peptidoglycan-binding domain-containing protein [Bacillota bacterium]|nr:LysM peptidoglycan-binding domain-containing protein [Bacillota bacterium]
MQGTPRKSFRISIIMVAVIFSMVLFGQVVAAAGSINSNTVQYIVKKGDNLWNISQKYDLALQIVISANPGISPDLIHPGQKIYIPLSYEGDNQGTGEPIATALASREGRNYSGNYSQKDIDLFARLVHSEAAGESYTGQVAY